MSGIRAAFRAFVSRRRPPSARPEVAYRPGAEPLETIDLLALIPLAGQYFHKTAPHVFGQPTSTADTGLNDFAVFDTATSTFYVAPNDGAPNRGVIAVSFFNPNHHTFLPLVGQYFNKSLITLPGAGLQTAYAGLADFAVYDVNTSTFYALANDADPYRFMTAVQVGDPSHALTPLVGQFFNKAAITLGGTGSLGIQGGYAGLDDFAVYDATTSTFTAAPNDANPYRNVNSVAFLNPGRHAFTPIVGPYINPGNLTAPVGSKQGVFAGPDDFAVFDATASTFYAAPNTVDPFRSVVGVTFSNPNRHAFTPLVGQYLNKSAILVPGSGFQTASNGLDDFAVFDATASTFYAAPNDVNPYRNVIAFSFANPNGRALVPLVGQYFNKALLGVFGRGAETTYQGLSDFAVYDPAASAFYAAPNDSQPYQNVIGVQVGDPTGPNTPLVGQYVNKGAVAIFGRGLQSNYSGLDDFTVYDAATSTFLAAPNTPDPSLNRVSFRF